MWLLEDKHSPWFLHPLYIVFLAASDIRILALFCLLLLLLDTSLPFTSPPEAAVQPFSSEARGVLAVLGFHSLCSAIFNFFLLNSRHWQKTMRLLGPYKYELRCEAQSCGILYVYSI